MVWLARFRSLVARHRVVYWSVVACLMMVVGATLVIESRRVNAARDAWGDVVEVWIADADIASGAPLAATRTTVPLAMVPARALTGDLPADAVARQHVSRGEMLVEPDIVSGRLPLVPDGWRAVAIAADDTTLELAMGDRVDVVAGGAVLASDGVVVQVGAGAVTIGVAAEDAPSVAVAALDRSAVVVFRPG